MWNRKKQGASGSARKIILLVIVGVLLLGALSVFLFRQQLNLDALFRKINYGGSGEYASYGLEGQGNARTALWNGGLAVGDGSTLTLLETSGKTAARQSVSMSEPVLLSGNRLVLQYDAGGKSLLAMDRSGSAVLDFATEGGIFSADIASDDHLCIAVTEEGYKTVLRCYDGGGREYYRWKASSGYLPDCAIAPGGLHLAAVSLGQKGGVFDEELTMFRTDREEPAASVSLGSDLIYGMHFVKDRVCCIVSEKAISFYNSDCECRGSYEYGTSYLTDFDWNGDGFVLAALNMYKAGSYYCITTVDYSGRELGSLYVNEDIQDVSAAGQYLAILTRDKVTVCRKDLSVYAEIPNTALASSVLMRQDGSVFLISGGEAKLVIP